VLEPTGVSRVVGHRTQAARVTDRAISSTEPDLEKGGVFSDESSLARRETGDRELTFPFSFDPW